MYALRHALASTLVPVAAALARLASLCMLAFGAHFGAEDELTDPALEAVDDPTLLTVDEPALLTTEALDVPLELA